MEARNRRRGVARGDLAVIVLGGIALFGLLISWLGVEVGLALAAALIAFVSWRWGRDSRDFQDSTSSVARR